MTSVVLPKIIKDVCNPTSLKRWGMGIRSRMPNHYTQRMIKVSELHRDFLYCKVTWWFDWEISLSLAKIYWVVQEGIPRANQYVLQGLDCMLIRHVVVGIIILWIWNSQWPLYNTKSKSDWLFTTKSIVLQAGCYWKIMRRQLRKLTCASNQRVSQVTCDQLLCAK